MEQVTAPTAWGLLITIQSIQTENAKGRKESDSLNWIPLWTSGCSANNPQVDHVQSECDAFV